MPKPAFNPETAAFRITCGKGFQMVLPNGYTVSIQFGPGNYADNPDRGDFRKEAAYMESKVANCAAGSAEVLAWDKDGKDYGQAKGWLTPAEVLAYINEVAAL